MRDIYLYDDCDVLKNLLGIKSQKLLDDAEADYISFRLKQLSESPLKGEYDYHHLLEMHKFIFQDLYEWAGQQRKLNIYKEEPVLGGLSIDYSDLFDIQQDAESILYEMRHKKWNFFDILESAVELLNP